MNLYVDLFIFENFIMNYLVIIIARMFANVKYRAWGSIFGALIGAVYALVAFLNGLTDNFGGLVLKIVVSAIIAFVSFDFSFKKGWLMRYLRCFASFYLAAFVVAGAAFAILYMANTSAEVYNGVIYWRGGTNVIYIFACGCTVLIILSAFVRWWKQRLVKVAANYELEISFGEKTAKCTAILDTGNSLFEQISGLPVLIVTSEIASQLLGEKYSNGIESRPLEAIEEFINKGSHEFVLVPFISVGEKAGMMLAFKAGKVIANGKECKPCYIAISPNNLSVSNEYFALINPNIL